MARFKGWFKAPGAERFAASGPNGGKINALEGLHGVGFFTLLFGKIEEMFNLDSSREDGSPVQTGDKFVQCLGKRGCVGWKRPAVDRNLADCSALGNQSADQFNIAAPIFLKRYLLLGTRFNRAKKFTPRIWFGHGNRHRHLPFPHDSTRFWATDDNCEMAQGGGESFHRFALGQNALKQSGPHTGEEDDHVEIARIKTVGKIEGLAVGGKRNLNQRRGDERLASVDADQFSDFLPAPAFKSEYPSVVERHAFRILAQARASKVATITKGFNFL